MQLLADMTCCTRPKRVAQSLMIGCVLIWFSHATCLAPKSNGLYYRTFTNILSHPIKRMSKLDVYFVNYLLWCTSATSVARWSIPQITCLLSSLVRARVSVLDASVLSLRYAAPSLHFSIRDGISPANRGILFTAYPATDVHFFTLLKLKEASGVVLGNVCEVYATTPLSFLWGNISTLRAQVFPMSRCVVWE